MPKMEGGIFLEHGIAWWPQRSACSRLSSRSGCGAPIRAAGCAAWAGRISRSDRARLARRHDRDLHAPKPVSISHACLAQLFFSTTVLIALFTRRNGHGNYRWPKTRAAPSLHAWPTAVPLCVLAQLALGAAARHRALGVCLTWSARA